MANKQIGAKLQELRKKNGLTQKDVYEKLGISQSTFSSWEIGKSEPDAMTFLELCDIYNVKDILNEFKGTQNNQYTSFLTCTESKLITAYRNHPEMQAAINKMLDIEDVIIDDEAHNNPKLIEDDNIAYSYGYVAAKGQAPRRHKINKEKEAEAMEALRRLREKNK